MKRDVCTHCGRAIIGQVGGGWMHENGSVLCTTITRAEPAGETDSWSSYVGPGGAGGSQWGGEGGR
jgi:hypothetical protein